MQESEQSQEVVNPIQTPDKSAKRLLHIGFGLTAAYLAPMLIYSFVELPHMKAMKPDEFATFLSGAFAPLAFLWLVLGFRQQGDELQNSARALWLQGEELRNSVEQQRQLVEVSREQLESELEKRRANEAAAESDARPRIVLTKGSSSTSGETSTFYYSVSTAGPTCTGLCIYINGNLYKRMPVFQAGDTQRLAIEFVKMSEVRNQEVEIKYVDMRGKEGKATYQIPFRPPMFAGRPPTLDDPILVA